MRKLLAYFTTIIFLMFFAFVLPKASYALSFPSPVCLFLTVGNVKECAATDNNQPLYDFQKAMPQITTDVASGIEQFLLFSIAGQGPVTVKTSDKNLSPQDTYNEYGALGIIGLSMKGMYDNPPVSTSEYLASIHPLGVAYADSSCPPLASGQVPTAACNVFGQTVLNFWGAARNFAYIIFIVILVVVGFMIMFRSRLDPRTTVTATAAIPNLIIALVLITFSLAIATLIINISQVLVDMVKLVMTQAIVTNSPLLASGQSGSVGFSITDIWARFLNPFSGSHYVYLGGGLAGGLAALLIWVIIAVVTFIVAIQVFFMLFLRYLNLIIKPIYAPFAFLFGAIPGKGSVTVNWFKSYLVDALTFPIALLLLNMAMALAFATSGSIGALGDPFGLISNEANLTPLIVIGILLIVTKVPAMLESAFDVKPDQHVSKAGANVQDLAKKTPFIGRFLG